MGPLRDIFGNVLHAGDFIVYPARRNGEWAMIFGRIVKASRGEDGPAGLMVSVASSMEAFKKTRLALVHVERLDITLRLPPELLPEELRTHLLGAQ